MKKRIRGAFMALSIDIDKLAHLQAELADKHIMPRFMNLKSDQIRTKAHAKDFATDADTDYEEDLIRIIPTMFPGIIVVGEEGVSAGTASLDVLKDPANTCIVADPLDGTGNFVDELTTFGSIQAVTSGGVTVAGLIYDPINRMHYIAVKGVGAFRVPQGYSGSYKDGERLHVSKLKDIKNGTGYIEPNYFPKEMQSFVRTLTNDAYPTLRCSAHEYINLATGQKDFMAVGHMKPWDHLAGVLLVEEAGGMVQKFDGSPYAITDETGGILVACNTRIMKQLNDKFISPAIVSANTFTP